MGNYKRIPVIRVTAKARAYRNKKVRCDFSIVSQTVLPEQIAQELSIEPNRAHKKGHYKREGYHTILYNTKSSLGKIFNRSHSKSGQYITSCSLHEREVRK